MKKEKGFHPYKHQREKANSRAFEVMTKARHGAISRQHPEMFVDNSVSKGRARYGLNSIFKHPSS